MTKPPLTTGARTPIRVPKTAEIVADHFRKRIIRAELREGDTLPPEGQLMTTLGISRPTLREAFRILEAENLIRVMRGSRTGAQVFRPRVDSVTRYAGFVLQSEGTTVGDLYEARLAIEPYVARRLAEARSADAVARLNEQIERLNALVDAGHYVEFMIGLAQFHRVLVELGGNRTLLFLTELLQGVLERHQVEYFQRRSLDPEIQRNRSLWGLRSFRKLVALIEAGDGDGAEAHWRLHVRNANLYWADGADAEAPIELLD
jgi:DNA-binding FadR family transcriptional regulator